VIDEALEHMRHTAFLPFAIDDRRGRRSRIDYRLRYAGEKPMQYMQTRNNAPRSAGPRLMQKSPDAACVDIKHIERATVIDV